MHYRDQCVSLKLRESDFLPAHEEIPSINPTDSKRSYIELLHYVVTVVFPHFDVFVANSFDGNESEFESDANHISNSYTLSSVIGFAQKGQQNTNVSRLCIRCLYI